jgi:hypothetical protein
MVLPMRSQAWRRTSVAAALVAAVVGVHAGKAGAQETPTDPSTRRRRLAARVARLKEGGDAPTARSPTGTRPLAQDGEVVAGEVVTAGDGPVELLFPTDEAAAKDRTVDAGERLILGPGAKATVAPLDTTVDVRLESGQAVARSTGDLRVQAGGSVVVVRSGDAAIDVEHKAGGAVDVRVDVLAGRVEVEGAGVTRGAAPGERVDVDARGTRVRKATPKPPKFLETLDAVAPQAVRLFERFATWPLPYTDPDRRHGEAFPLGSPAKVGTTAPWIDEGGKPEDVVCTASVHFGFAGQDGQGGLVALEPTTRLRLRYRASRSTTLWVNLRRTDDEHFSSSKVTMRANAWTDLELHPGRFVSPDAAARPLERGVVTYVDICAGEPTEPKEPELKLELQHVLFYE